MLAAVAAAVVAVEPSDSEAVAALGAEPSQSVSQDSAS